MRDLLKFAAQAIGILLACALFMFVLFGLPANAATVLACKGSALGSQQLQPLETI